MIVHLLQPKLVVQRRARLKPGWLVELRFSLYSFLKLFCSFEANRFGDSSHPNNTITEALVMEEAVAVQHYSECLAQGRLSVGAAWQGFSKIIGSSSQFSDSRWE